MTRKKVVIIVLVVLVMGAVVGANLYFKRDTGSRVTAEDIRARDLEALVSASGKIQPKRKVDVWPTPPAG
jgi:HlyD family secretion protein